MDHTWTMSTSPLPSASAVAGIRDQVVATRFPLALPSSDQAAALQDAIANQVDNYVLPRLENLGAPLLVVVGGSTGVGKSTLINTLVKENISAAGVTRPTTRQPLLVTSPADVPWFRENKVLPGLVRVESGSLSAGTESAPGSLRIRTSSGIPAHMALLDAPDIDSVSDENRALARELLAAADLWVFVTTAARYADQVAWDLLAEAAGRGIGLAVVLNRVPHGAQEEVGADLHSLLGEQGLPDVPVFTIVEEPLGPSGRLPEGDLAALEEWLGSISDDKEAREALVYQALEGTLRQMAGGVRSLATWRGDQISAAEDLSGIIKKNYADAADSALTLATDGSLLRGEVLARWQDFVGTTDVFRTFEKWVGTVRDQFGGWFRGESATSPEAEVEEEMAAGLSAILVDKAGAAAQKTWRDVHQSQAGTDLYTDITLERPSPGTSAAAIGLVREWQGELLDLVRQETPGKRQRARLLSLGLNAVTVALMLLVFASTGGLLGGEIAIAGGSAVVGQKLLETLFGDQAVRALAKKGEERLRDRITDFFDEEASRYRQVLQPVWEGPSPQDLRESADQLSGSHA